MVAGWSFNIERRAKELEEDLAEKRLRKWERWIEELQGQKLVSTGEGLMSTENNLLEIIDAEQSQQRSENNKLRKRLIEDGNQLQNRSTMVEALSCNQRNNGGNRLMVRWLRIHKFEVMVL